MTDVSGREVLVWLVVLSVPPGIGMTGFVAVAFQAGAVTPTALAVGLLTSLSVGALVRTVVSGGEGFDGSGDTGVE